MTARLLSIIGTFVILLSSPRMIFAAEPASTRPSYMPMPVAYVAPLQPDAKAPPFLAIGALPDGRTSPVHRDAIARAFYSTFRDNQLGRNSVDDPNAADYAAGQLQLSAPREGAQVVIAIAPPANPAGGSPWLAVQSFTREGNELGLSINFWRAGDELTDQSKIVNRREVQLLYLPALPQGEYRLGIVWQEMTPNHADDLRGWTVTEFRFTQITFVIQPADHASPATRPSAATKMDFQTLSPQPMPPSPEWRLQEPIGFTARLFSAEENVPAGLSIGCGNPFNSLRGEPAVLQQPTALPRLDPPRSDETAYAMFVGQPIGGANTWMTLNSIGWHGSTITIEASLWTNPNDANRNPSARPMLLVQLIPPASRRALAPVTPPGHYQVDLIIHRFADTTSNDWYTAAADEKQHAEVDVK